MNTTTNFFAQFFDIMTDVKLTTNDKLYEHYIPTNISNSKVLFILPGTSTAI